MRIPLAAVALHPAKLAIFHFPFSILHLKVLYVLPGTSQLPASTEAMAEAGLFYAVMHPSPISALTALQIASEADKCAATHVRVSRVADAMAAVSARKVAKSPFKIIMEVEPCAEPPRRIPRDILAGVDAWIFPAEIAVWPDIPTARVIILPPCGEPLASLPLVAPADTRNGGAHPLWIGPIDGNYDRLRQAVEVVGPDQTLRICGTGKARHTMPIVRRSREKNAAIEWLGETYNLTDELARATSIIQSGPTPTLLELRAASLQTPLPHYQLVISNV